MDDRYDLHKRLQEATSRADVALRNFKGFHHIAYTTFYEFVKKPELARDRTLVSVRLVCEFLECALAAKLLPMSSVHRKDRAEVIDKLYEHWWANDKKFVKKEPEHVEQS